MVRNDMIWYDMVWYIMVWYGLVWYAAGSEAKWVQVSEAS